MIKTLLYLFWSFGGCYATNNLFIWKGTQWCGYGSVPNNSSRDNVFLANSEITRNETDSLKINENVDSCCKTHDHCKHFIPRWQRKYHLLNWRPFTISSCTCDRKFLECLNKDNSLSAQDVKRIYFDILNIPCFKFELRDVRKCVKRTWFMACKRYVMKTELFAIQSSVEKAFNKNDTML